MRREQETRKNIWDDEKLSCHFEPFANAQGRLREKSLFRPKREICLRSLAFAQYRDITTQTQEPEGPLPNRSGIARRGFGRWAEW